MAVTKPALTIAQNKAILQDPARGVGVATRAGLGHYVQERRDRISRESKRIGDERSTFNKQNIPGTRKYNPNAQHILAQLARDEASLSSVRKDIIRVTNAFEALQRSGKGESSKDRADYLKLAEIHKKEKADQVKKAIAQAAKAQAVADIEVEKEVVKEDPKVALKEVQATKEYKKEIEEENKAYSGTLTFHLDDYGQPLERNPETGSVILKTPVRIEAEKVEDEGGKSKLQELKEQAVDIQTSGVQSQRKALKNIRDRAESLQKYEKKQNKPVHTTLKKGDSRFDSLTEEQWTQVHLLNKMINERSYIPPTETVSVTIPSTEPVTIPSTEPESVTIEMIVESIEAKEETPPTNYPEMGYSPVLGILVQDYNTMNQQDQSNFNLMIQRLKSSLKERVDDDTFSRYLEGLQGQEFLLELFNWRRFKRGLSIFKRAPEVSRVQQEV